METFNSAKINGNRVNVYILDSFIGTGTFDPKKYPQIFGNLAISPIACGVAIEPIRGEHLDRALAGEDFKLPAYTFQPDSALFVFSQYAHIDLFIQRLQECRGKLEQNYINGVERRCLHMLNEKIVDITDVKETKAANAILKYIRTGELPPGLEDSDKSEVQS